MKLYNGIRGPIFLFEACELSVDGSIGKWFHDENFVEKSWLDFVPKGKMWTNYSRGFVNPEIKKKRRKKYKRNNRKRRRNRKKKKNQSKKNRSCRYRKTINNYYNR